ncbi:MAG: putative metalloprotease CJM1_0395 family protein [Caldimicrobium sp.]
MKIGFSLSIGSYQQNNLEGNLVNSANPTNSSMQKDSANQRNIKSNDDIEKVRIEQEIQKLKRIEQKVIAHEMAHKIVGGQYAGPVRYVYARGPDNKMYIVGGEVSIDVSKAATPEETIKKMEQVQRAALAPADPSPQDRAIAVKAAMQAQEAKMELWLAKQREKSFFSSGFNKTQEATRKLSIYV